MSEETKRSFQAVKGTRDFYPDEMRLRNYIMDAWRRVSLRNGFEEYDAPIFEYLELFTIKSGEEIAEQLFSLTDRGGRNLAIRPEITPSLARMVAAKINAHSGDGCESFSSGTSMSSAWMTFSPTPSAFMSAWISCEKSA